MSDTRIKIEASSSSIGEPTSIAYLDPRGGKLRLVSNSNSVFIVRQVNNNVDISVQLSNDALLPQIIPRITSVTPSGLSYRIVGTARTNTTIRVNGVSTPVLMDGTFSLIAPLYQGVNSIIQESIDGSILTNSIYLIEGDNNHVINPVVVTSIVDNLDGIYQVSGTGTPNSTITIAGVDVIIGEDGNFSADNIPIITGINLITSDGNNVGSVYLNNIDSPLTAVVTNIAILDNGTYQVSGTGTPNSTITIAGVDVIIDNSGQFNIPSIQLDQGINSITSDDDVIGSIYIDNTEVVRESVVITSIVQNPDITYNLVGMGPSGLEIMISDRMIIIDEDGQFSLDNIALEDGINTITSDDGVVGSVYINNTNSYVIVDNVTNNGDGTYTITGTTSYDSISINGIDANIVGDTFTVHDTKLVVGDNPILSDGRVVGSLFIEESIATSTIVTEIDNNDDGTYNLAGTGTPNSMIIIAEVDITIDEDGNFSASNIPLTTGLNEITSNGQSIGSIFVNEKTNLVSVTEMIYDGNYAYTVNGTGPPNLDIVIEAAHINTYVTIGEDGTFSSPNTELSIGLNLITSDGNVVGSIYLEQISESNELVMITSMTPTIDYTYEVTGTGPPGMTIEIGGESLAIDSDGNFSGVVTLIEELNVITSDDDNVGSLYLAVNNSVQSPVTVTNLSHIEDDQYSISGTAPPFQELIINGIELQANSTGEFGTEVTLSEGFNPILDQDGNILNGVYIIATEPSLIVINSIEPRNNDMLAIQGTSSREDDYDIYLNNDKNIGFVGNDGEFVMLVPISDINNGLNTLSYSDGIIGSYLYYDRDLILTEVTISGRNLDGSYNVEGRTLPSISIELNGVTTTSDVNGFYELTSVILNPGESNYILYNGDSIAVIVVEVNSIAVDNVTSNGSNYNIEGTTTYDELTINGTTVTVVDGDYSFVDIPLTEGFNQISGGDSSAGIYIRSSDSVINVVITDTILNSDGTYTVTGQGSEGLTVTINGESATISDGEFTITTSLNNGINLILDDNGNTIGSFYMNIPDSNILEGLAILDYNSEVASINGIGGPPGGTVSIMNSNVTGIVNSDGTWELTYDPDSAPSPPILLFTDINGRQSPLITLPSTVSVDLNLSYDVNTGDYIISGGPGSSIPNNNYNVEVNNTVVESTISGTDGSIRIAVNPNVTIPGGSTINVVDANSSELLAELVPSNIIYDIRSIDNGANYVITSPPGTIEPSIPISILYYQDNIEVAASVTSEADGSLSVTVPASDIHNADTLYIAREFNNRYESVIVPSDESFTAIYNQALQRYTVTGVDSSVPANTSIALYNLGSELPNTRVESNSNGSVTITTDRSTTYAASIGSNANTLYGNVILPLISVEMIRLTDGSYQLIGSGPSNILYRATTAIPIMGGISRDGSISTNIPEYAVIPGESIDIIISEEVVATVAAPQLDEGEVTVVYVQNTNEYRIIAGDNTISGPGITVIVRMNGVIQDQSLSTETGAYELAIEAIGNIIEGVLVTVNATDGSYATIVELPPTSISY